MKTIVPIVGLLLVGLLLHSQGFLYPAVALYVLAVSIAHFVFLARRDVEGVRAFRQGTISRWGLVLWVACPSALRPFLRRRLFGKGGLRDE